MKEAGIFYIDVGSTQIKLAEMDENGSIINQMFYFRDLSVKASEQIISILEAHNKKSKAIRICSSANGGIRVGIIALTNRFSGSAARNLALGAGANVIFTHILSDQSVKNIDPVDTLIIMGGIDCEHSPRLESKIVSLDLSRYKFRNLVYAGNQYLAELFLKRFPKAIVVDNPFRDELEVRDHSLLNYIRNMYLEDLIDKDNIRDLAKLSEIPILPTPGIVNMAFEKLTRQKLELKVPLPCIVIDIGGATTDIHFGVETLKLDEGMDSRLYLLTNRYVFTDLGVFSSRSSTLSRLSNHTRLYEFLQVVVGDNARQVYLELREGNISDEVLFYGCFFLAFDQISCQVDNITTNIDLNKLSSIIVTGGASQVVTLKHEVFSGIISILRNTRDLSGEIKIVFDKKYEIWIHGISSVMSSSNNLVN